MEEAREEVAIVRTTTRLRRSKPRDFAVRAPVGALCMASEREECEEEGGSVEDCDLLASYQERLDAEGGATSFRLRGDATQALQEAREGGDKALNSTKAFVDWDSTKASAAQVPPSLASLPGLSPPPARSPKRSGFSCPPSTSQGGGMLDPNSWRLTLLSCGVRPATSTAAQPPSPPAADPRTTPRLVCAPVRRFSPSPARAPSLPPSLPRPPRSSADATFAPRSSSCCSQPTLQQRPTLALPTSRRTSGQGRARGSGRVRRSTHGRRRK